MSVASPSRTRVFFCSAQDAANRRADIAGRQRAGRDLIQKRLEEVKVAAVDDRHVDGRVPEFARGVQPAESASENDDAVCDDFRIAKRGVRCRPEAAACSLR